MTLCSLLKKYQVPIKFIQFNEIKDLKRNNKEQLWADTIKKYNPNLKVKIYAPPGRGVGSSCGQFTKHYYHEEIETEEEHQKFIKWKNLYQVH